MPDTCPLSPGREAEILRLHDAGMSPDQLGARFRLEYRVIARIVAAERKRRADAWATRGPGLGWPERRPRDNP